MTASGDGAVGTPEPGGTPGRGQAWRSAVELLGLVAPIGVLTGVLYYFGYVSAKAFFSHFGVSLSILDFDTTTYLVRSPDTLFQPVLALLLVAVVVFVVHQLLGRALTVVAMRWKRGITIGIGGTGLVLGVIGLLGVDSVFPPVPSALALALSAVLLEYGLWAALKHAEPPASAREIFEAATNLRRGLLAAVVLVAGFWAVTVIAYERGEAAAGLFELSLPVQPQAVVYAQTDLQIPGPGVGRTVIDSEGYGFRYNGLRQLLYANGRWFLLPVGWTHDNGSTVIVLPDDHAGSRVDLAP